MSTMRTSMLTIYPTWSYLPLESLRFVRQLQQHWSKSQMFQVVDETIFLHLLKHLTKKLKADSAG